MSKPITLARYLSGNLALIVIPLFLASTISFFALTNAVKESFVDINRLSATLVSECIEEFFMRPQEVLFHIATILENRERYTKFALDAYLKDTFKEFEFLDRIQIIGPNSRIIGVTPFDPSLIGISRAGETVYESAKKNDRIFWSDSYISTGENRSALTFGRKIGVYTVLCDINLAWLGTLADSIDTHETEKMEVRVTDRNGVFLSSPAASEVARRESQTDFKRLREGSNFNETARIREGDKFWYVSSVQIPGPDWYVFVQFPESIFADALLKHELELLAIGSLSVIIVIIIWRSRFRNIEKILGAISAQADRISIGTYEPLEGFGGNFSEFQRVGKSLDRMVSAIEEREKDLRRREQCFRKILERINLPAISIDSSGTITFANAALEKIVYGTEKSLIGQHVTRLHTMTNDNCPFTRFLKNAPLKSLERCMLRDSSNGERIIDWSIVPSSDTTGSTTGFTAIGHDLTESLRQRELIEQSLREKEIILRELFHRTRNNMQVIMGILTATAEEEKNEQLDEIVRKTNDRILSMSIVHKKLFDSLDLSRIDLRDYCMDLIDFLGKGETGKGIWITISAPSEQVTALIDSAIPFGLVVHELIANALKHAYPRNASGEIRLTLGLSESRDIYIEVADNGVGLPAGFDVRESGRLGFKLIHNLVESQLQGTLEFNNKKGLSCVVRFTDAKTLKRI